MWLLRSIYVLGCAVIVESCWPWTYGDWYSWGPCSASCGGGTRQRYKESCVQKDRKYEDQTCNQFCYNGGSFYSGSCHCPSWRTGSCCADCRHIYIQHCKSGQQQCGGSPDNIRCTECEKPYTSAGYGNGCDILGQAVTLKKWTVSN